MLKRFLFYLLILVTSTTPALTHTIKINDEVIDYSQLKGGPDGTTPCCDNSHCRPASEWEWVSAKKQWRFHVPIDPFDKASKYTDVFVDDADVTHDNLTKKSKTAHWCGYFIEDSEGKREVVTYCAFVPVPPAT